MDKDNSKEEKVMDQYTQYALEHGISRRSFLSRTAKGAAGLGVLGLAGSAAKSANGATAGEGMTGATATMSMTHIAIVEQLDGKTADWMEQVSDEQYRR